MAMSDERSGRVLSRMDPEMKATHLRLEGWAKWAKENVRAWPERTLLGKLCDGELGRTENRTPTTMPDHIASVDAAVSWLGAIDQKVIKAYYLNWAPPEFAARRVHMRLTQFQNVLRRARWRISGYLAARGD